MENNEALTLLQRKNLPLNINQAIDLIETKIKWCDDILKCNNPNNSYVLNRVGIERTTLGEALDIIKRVKKYPHDINSKEVN